MCLNRLVHPAASGSDPQAEAGNGSGDGDQCPAASAVDAGRSENSSARAEELPDALFTDDVPIAIGRERIEAQKRLKAMLDELTPASHEDRHHLRQFATFRTRPCLSGGS